MQDINAISQKTLQAEKATYGGKGMPRTFSPSVVWLGFIP